MDLVADHAVRHICVLLPPRFADGGEVPHGKGEGISDSQDSQKPYWDLEPKDKVASGKSSCASSHILK